MEEKKTSMVNVRIDENLKASVSTILAGMGLTTSDVIRMTLTKIATEGRLPEFLTTDPAVYDAWFRKKVREAMEDDRPDVPHEEVMAGLRARLASKAS